MTRINSFIFLTLCNFFYNLTFAENALNTLNVEIKDINFDGKIIKATLNSNKDLEYAKFYADDKFAGNFHKDETETETQAEAKKWILFTDNLPSKFKGQFTVRAKSQNGLLTTTKGSLLHLLDEQLEEEERESLLRRTRRGINYGKFPESSNFGAPSRGFYPQDKYYHVPKHFGVPLEPFPNDFNHHQKKPLRGFGGGHFHNHNHKSGESCDSFSSEEFSGEDKETISASSPKTQVLNSSQKPVSVVSSLSSSTTKAPLPSTSSTTIRQSIPVVETTENPAEDSTNYAIDIRFGQGNS